MRNRYKVPKRQWRKWDERARNVFNTLYATMIADQRIYNAAPNAPALPRAAWRTVAWNAAFVAACAA